MVGSAAYDGVSVVGAVGEGVRLIRRRPLDVIVWGGVRAAFAVAMLAILAPTYITEFGRMMAAAQAGATAPPDLSGMMRLQGIALLIDVVMIAMEMVLLCAVWRAVLHPEEGRWAHMRLGSAELIMFFLIWGFVIAVFIGVVAAAIPIAVLIGIGVVTHSGALIGVLVAALVLALVVFLIWVACRASLIGPMTVDDGRLHLADAWALTRGHAKDLFVLALCLIAIMSVVDLIFGVAVVLSFASALAGAGGVQALPQFAASPSHMIRAFAPLYAVFMVVMIPIGGALSAFLVAPWARAYRDLVPAA